jgi:uncharacterized paraquat-inducible protein A
MISMLIAFIAYKATDISYTPGVATKAAEELVKQMNEIEELQENIRNTLPVAVERCVIGLSVDWERAIETKLSPPPTTAWCVTSASHKRCAYCDTLNDHSTGVCDRCGAPL